MQCAGSRPVPGERCLLPEPCPVYTNPVRRRATRVETVSSLENVVHPRTSFATRVYVWGRMVGRPVTLFDIPRGDSMIFTHLYARSTPW